MNTSDTEVYDPLMVMNAKNNILNSLKDINANLKKLDENFKVIGTDKDTKQVRNQTSSLLKDTSIQIRELSRDITKFGELPTEGGLHKKKQHIDQTKAFKDNQESQMRKLKDIG